MAHAEIPGGDAMTVRFDRDADAARRSARLSAGP